MKENLYFSRLLSLLFLAALFGACSPEYGAHFQNSPSPSYAQNQKDEAEPTLHVRQDKGLSTSARELAERSGAEEVQTNALPAVNSLEYLEIPEMKDLRLQKQEAMHQVRERLNNMSRKEKRALRREIRQLRLSTEREFIYEKGREYGLEQDDIDENLALLIILAILIPPLGVFLHQGEINKKFWISLLLTLLFFVPGAIYSVLVVLGEL